MLKIITSLVVFLAGLTSNGQVSETRTVSTFNKIEITDGVEVIYTQSENTSLKAEASDALGLSTLLTQNDGNTLKISCNGNRNENVKVYVSSPEIISVKASKESKVIFADRVDTKKFALSLNSGSEFRGIVNSESAINLKGKAGSIFNIRIDSQTLYGNFQSGTKVNLSGKSGDASIRTTGNALCSARNFKTDNVNVKAGDESTVEVSVHEAIAVDVTDQASVKYFGLPAKAKLNLEAVTVSNPKSSVTQN